MRGLLLSGCLLLPMLAIAGPDAFAPRPVWVPAKGLSAELTYEPTIATAGGQTASGHTLMADVKYGLLDGLELGLTGGIDLNGDGPTRRLGIEVEGSPWQAFAARLDATGYQQTVSSFYADGVSSTESGIALGVGGAFRLSIDKRFGLIGGRSIARPPLGPGPVYSFGDDWLTIDFNHRDVFASVGLPLGVFFEPTPGLAFELRSGFRHVWGGGLVKADFVPVGLDFLANLTPHLDLSASVELPGETDFFFNLVQARATLVLRF